MVKIKYENAKYIIDAQIHTEVATSDIAEVQEHFAVECVAEFAEEIKHIVRMNELIEKKKKDNKEMNEQFAGKYLI